MKRLWTLLLLLGVSLVAEDLGTVEIVGEKEGAPFASVFEEPAYIDHPGFLDNAPAQKRLTTEEAMFIPGIQGDPVKAVKSLSGVTALGDVTGELYIYGSKPEESQTTFNHLPLGYLFHMYGIHSVVAPEAIEQIDAYLGGFDVTYGDAMGGVINVTPKYPGQNLSGHVHLGIYDASAGLQVPLNDKTSLFVGARRSYYDLYLNATGQAEGDLDEDGKITYTQFPNYYDLTLIGAYRPNDHHRFSLEIIGADDKLTINTQDNAVKDPEATGEIDAQSGFITTGLRWENFYDNYSSNTLAYYLNFKTDSKFFDGYYLDYKSNLFGLFHQSTYEARNHRIVAGAEVKYYNTPIDANVSQPCGPEEVDCDFTSAEKYLIDETVDLTTLSLFLEDIYTPVEPLQLRYGIRTLSSDYGNLGTQVDPRFSIVYALDERSNLSFSTGRYTQLPEGYKLQKDMGNVNLGYEQAWHTLLHYDFAFTDRSRIAIEPFYKHFNDLAVEDNATNFQSRGKGYAYGLDASLKIREGSWYGFIAYTYLRSKRQIDTEDSRKYRFYGEVPHTLQLLGAYRFGGNWSVSTLVKYHSGRPYTPITGTYTDTDGRIRPLYGEPFSERLDDYFTLNVKIAQQIRFRDSSLEWSFELMNATNRENVSGIEYDDHYNQSGVYTQLPLLPWLDVTYRF